MRFFVTGCAGFVGSNLVDRLLAAGHDVVGIDNLSTGDRKNLEGALGSARFTFVEGDLIDGRILPPLLEDCDAVFHFAANADVRYGLEHTTKDLEQNVVCTVNVLEAMRITRTKRIAFSSTGSIYGEASTFPTREDEPIPVQTSLYGASKFSAEAFIQAYAEGFQLEAYIFRFVSLLGERYSHGHVIDFYNQLKAHPEHLRVLGNGKQRKSYLYVGDCIDAMLMCLERAHGKVNIFNLGTDEYCEVLQSATWICDAMGVSPHVTTSGGERGWVGDNPFVFLDCTKVRSLGWQPTLTIKESVANTVRYLESNATMQGS